VYAARVTAAGAVPDPAGRPITTAPYAQASAYAAWSGSSYYVVWADGRNATFPGAREMQIFGARVSRAGVVEDAQATPISATIEEHPGRFGAGIASDGRGFLVAWTTGRQIDGARVSAAGELLDRTPLTLVPPGDYDETPRLAFDGRHYAIVWDQWYAGPEPRTHQAQVVWAIGGDPSAVTRRYGLGWGEAGTAPAVASAGGGTSLVLYSARDAVSRQQRVWTRLVAANAAPVATPQEVSVAEDSRVGVVLAGTDGDGGAGPLTFEIAAGPAHGRLEGAPPSVTYVPAADYHGPDSFSFRARDAIDASAPAVVSIAVTPA
jgi:hypothetical protein